MIGGKVNVKAKLIAGKDQLKVKLNKVQVSKKMPNKMELPLSSYENKRAMLRKYLINKEEPNQEIKKTTSPPEKLENIDRSMSPDDVLSELKIDENTFLITERFLFLFGSLYSMLAIVAFVFYSHKQALYLTGIPCALHMFKHLILNFNKMILNISSSISNLLINFIWLIYVFSIIIYYILKDNDKEDKIEFNDEIILHVGLVIYSPIVIYSSFLSVRMIARKIDFMDVYNEIVNRN